MRKIILAAVIAGAALSLAACSEDTSDAAGDTVEGAMADTQTNAEAMGEGVDAMADDAGAAADGAVAEAEVAIDAAGEAIDTAADAVDSAM